MKLFRLVIPIVAGLALAFGTLAAFAGGRAAPASPPPPNASETDLLPSSGAQNIHADATGKLWITEIASDTVRQFDPATRAYTLYMGLAGPRDAQLGPDGNVWWIQTEPQAVARMDLGSRLVTTWPVTTSFAVALAFDGSNRVWFVDALQIGVYRFNPSGNEFCDFALPGGTKGGPFIAEHNGALWLGDTVSSTLGRITETTNVYTYWPLSFGGGNPAAYAVTFAPNGDVWWADFGLGKVGRLEPGANRLMLFGPPNVVSPRQVAYHAGKVWFTDPYTSGASGTLGVIDPAVAVGLGPVVVTPVMVTLSPDCANVGPGSTFTAGMNTGVASFSPLVFTSTVDTEGTLYQVPAGGKPYGLAFMGFDLWSTDIGRNKLMRIDTAAAHLYLPLTSK